MQYDERKTKPESPRKFLIQQVEEQSTLCDVTVKIGHWEKKFHQCVLVVSPFFDHALKDNFLEKQTGKIEMKVGTPATIEMAIMFLYGKKPKLTQDNIEHTLNLAEFLLIPNLKSACISWLKAVTITGENCMDLLQISSIYDFEILKCNEYLIGHMPEMLQHAQTVNLSKDSVQYLFSEKKLSYVPMDDKVDFLIRWESRQPAKRKNYLKELFEMIDFSEVSKAVLDELKKNKNVSGEIDLENILLYTGNENCHKHRVLIMKGEDRDGTLWCFDIEREKWFRLKPEVNQDWSNYCTYSENFGARLVSSEIYFTSTTYQLSNIFILNLEEDVCKTYQVVNEDDGNNFKGMNGVCIVGDICIAFENERVQTNKPTRSDPGQRNIQSTLQMMSLLGIHPMNQILALKMIEDDSTIPYRYMDIATLYIGNIKDEMIKMSPLLTFKDDRVSNICINAMLTVAFIFGSRKCVSFLDLVDCKIETLQVKTEYDDRIVQSDDGFIIYNNKRCICLTRISGPLLSCKFRIKEISFKSQDMSHKKYIFCENTWYRYCCVKYEGQVTFERASHTDMTSKSSIEDVAWKKLPLPKEESRCYSSTIRDSLFQICLPKSKLRCDIECPHCMVKPEGTFRRQVSIESLDVDDIYYDDSSDDGFYFDSD